MFSRLFYILAWISILSGIALILLVTFWMTWPYKPITFNKIAKVITKETKRGGEFIYEMDYCKNMAIPATLTKEYIDGVVYATPPIIVNNPTGCGIRGGLTVVPNLPKGTYSMRFSYTYKVNPLRDVTVVIESEPFKIVD